MTDQTTRFAFWGRVSTEDNQDPESSRAWQITRGQDPDRAARRADRRRVLRHRQVPLDPAPAPARGQPRCSPRSPTPNRGLRGGRGGGAAAGVLRQPVRQHLPAVRPLRRAAVGARGRRPDRPGQRSPRPDHVRVRRRLQRRAEPDQDPRPHRHGRPGPARRPLPRRPPALRLQADRRRAAPQPGQGRRRQATARPRPSTTRPPPWSQRIFAEFLAGHGIFAIAETPDPRRHPVPVRARPGPQPAPLRHRLVQVRRPRHPDQPPLHRPPGLEQAAQRRSAASTCTTSRSATPPRCGGTTHDKWIYSDADRPPADHRRRHLRPGPAAARRPRTRARSPHKPHQPRTPTRCAACCSAASATGACKATGPTPHRITGAASPPSTPSPTTSTTPATSTSARTRSSPALDNWLCQEVRPRPPARRPSTS